MTDVGAVTVDVEPTFRGFATELRTNLKRITAQVEKSTATQVNLKPSFRLFAANAAQDLRKITARIEKSGAANVRIGADTKGLASELRTELNAVTDSVSATDAADVTVGADTGSLLPEIDTATAAATRTVSASDSSDVTISADTGRLVTQTATATSAAGTAAGVGFASKFSAAVTSGPALAGATAAVGLLVPTAVAAGFEEVENRIVSLVGVSKEELVGLRDDVFELSRATGVLPKALEEALFFITSAGLEGDTALDALTASATAAAAGLGEITPIADAVTSAINAYGIENLSASQATDVLVGTVRAAKTEAADLAPQFGKVLPFASELGVSFDDVGAALAFLTRTSGDAAAASTGLRGILSKLIKPTQAGRDALEGIGLSIEDLRAAADEDLLGALQLIVDRFAAVGDTEGLAKVFEDAEGLGAVLALTGENAKVAEGVFEDLDETAGLTADAFGTAEGGLGFQVNQLQADIATLATEIGLELLPTAKDLLAFIRDEAIPAFEDFIESEDFQTFIDDVQELGTAIADLARELKPFLPLFGLFVRGLIAAATLNFRGIAFGLRLVAGAVNVARFAFGQAVSFGVRFVEFIKSLPARVKGALLAINRAFFGLPVTIARALGRLASTIAESFRSAFRTARRITSNTISRIVRIVSGLGRRIADGLVGFGRKLWDRIKGGFNLLRNRVKERVDQIVQFFKDIPSRIGDVLSSIPGGGLLGGVVGGLAEGAIVTQPTVAVIGEDGPELVLPLSKPERAAELLNAAGLQPDTAARTAGPLGAAGLVADPETSQMAVDELIAAALTLPQRLQTEVAPLMEEWFLGQRFLLEVWVQDWTRSVERIIQVLVRFGDQAAAVMQRTMNRLNTIATIGARRVVASLRSVLTAGAVEIREIVPKLRNRTHRRVEPDPQSDRRETHRPPIRSGWDHRPAGGVLPAHRHPSRRADGPRLQRGQRQPSR